MSLPYILEIIEIKTQEEINQVHEQSTVEKALILESAQQEAKKIRANLIKELEHKMAEKINTAKRQAETHYRNKIILHKREIIEQILQKGVQRLAQDPDTLAKLYSRLAGELPKNEPGEIIAGKESHALIAEIVKRLALPFSIKDGLTEPGWKFIGLTSEIDNRLSRLLLDVGAGLEIEIAKMLFI